MKAALLLILSAAAVQAQFVEGAVYDAATGAPVPGARVSAGNMDNGPKIRSDAAGHFRLALTPNHVPTLTVMKAGYRESFARIEIGKEQSIRVDLTPQAVITGKVLDEDGFPAGNGSVHAMRWAIRGGQRTLVIAGSGQIDERGEYRVERLLPGRYYIRVFSNDAINWDRRYAAQFRGGTLRPDDDRAIEVKIGETIRNADIHLVKYEGVTLSGRIETTGIPGRRNSMVWLTSADLPMGTYPAGLRNEDMTFTVRHVPPGTYRLTYGLGDPQDGDLTAKLTVEVGDHDIRDLVLAAHVAHAADLEGQVSLREGGTPGPWFVYLRSQSGAGASAHTGEDGSFAVKALPPGHYQVQVTPDGRALQGQPPPPGHVVSITLGDRDVREQGFDFDGPAKPLRITVSAQYAAVSGAIFDAQGQPLANARIFFQSDQPQAAGIASTDSQGAFAAMLPEPGDYRVYELDQAAENALDVEEYFRAHRDDYPLVRVVLGDNRPVRLERTPGPRQ